MTQTAWLALALLLALIPRQVGAQPSEGAPLANVRFNFSEGVTVEDQTYIREGIRLAHDYVQLVFGIAVQQPIFVGVIAWPSSPADARPDYPSPDYPPRAMTDGHGVSFNTAHPLWLQLPPLLRVKIVVHEYVHVLENELSGGPGRTPGWLWEGIPEFIGYRALAARGLVNDDEVRALNAWNLAKGPGLAVAPEDTDWLRRYSEAFLRVELLVAQHGVGSLRAYLEALGRDMEHPSAFAAAFGQRPEAFDVAADRMRSDLVVPAEMPPRFEPPGPPLNTAAMVVVRTVAGPTAWSGQAVIIAETAPNARCTLTVRTANDKDAVSLPTTAGASGNVFWLWTVPENLEGGAAVATAACGGAAVSVDVGLEE